VRNPDKLGATTKARSFRTFFPPEPGLPNPGQLS
jgi:hypothetical protein